MPRKIKGYGWNPDLPDGRDLFYGAPLETVAKLPDKVDLRSKCPAVYDQGQLGSCTANAIGAAFEFDERKQGDAHAFMPSRLFIYYNEREREGTVDSDSGAQIRDGVKSVSKEGVCPEKDWPYDIDSFAKKPPASCYEEGKANQALRYLRLQQNLSQLKGCLATGFPFVYGFLVYESFETKHVAETGKVPMPRQHEQVLGGHAVMAVGYDEEHQWFVVRNSWGAGWGDDGYFYMPYPYLLQSSLSRDFWTIRSVEEGS